jgi:hypothetical protein
MFVALLSAFPTAARITPSSTRRLGPHPKKVSFAVHDALRACTRRH